ncbi:MAG: hypothetical protein ABJZ55_09330 [Fuerstiella sp.]
MSIDELLQQLGEYEAKKELRDNRPEWLDAFVHQIAEVFEPLSTVGRVGFECQADERGWLVSMFLGTTEIIGGPRDGQIDHAGFLIDIVQLQQQFQTVERFEWYSVAESDPRFNEPIRSLLVMSGQVEEGHNVRLELLSSPPKYVDSGLKKPQSFND